MQSNMYGLDVLCRKHITLVLENLYWLKVQDIFTYKSLMLTYKSYYNMAPPYLRELISRKESSANTRLRTDHHNLIIPLICPLLLMYTGNNKKLVRIVLTLFLNVHSFMLLHANGTN